jgi:hypothetical protein
VPVVMRKWRISGEESAATREARSDSACERTKPPNLLLGAGIFKVESEVVVDSSSSSASSSNHPIVGKSPNSTKGVNACSKSAIAKDSSTSIPVRDRFIPLVV